MSRIATAVLIALATTTAGAADRLTDAAFATRSEVIAQHGMAATSQPLATQAALDVLKAGGSAVDAAIAANACLGLMEPTGNGIGGDLFAIVWDAKTKKLYGYNGSGRSPKSLTLDYFQERGMTQIPYLGPLTVSVPGAVDGWFELHGRYGRLPMTELLAPAIRYAEEGFPVSEVIAYYWAGGATTTGRETISSSFGLSTSWRITPERTIIIGLSKGLTNDSQDFSLSLRLPLEFEMRICSIRTTSS